MERFSLILVVWATMCLLVHSHARPGGKLWTMYFRGIGLKVKPNHTIIGKRGSPTLFNLVREKNYHKINKSTNESDFKFSLEAIATGNLICMNQKGVFYTMQVKKAAALRVKGERKQRRRRSGKRALPHEDCLFRSVKFDFNHTYERAVGIYSVPHSNITIGRFMSFNLQNGEVRSYRKSFDQLENNSRIRINLTPVKNVHAILNKTVFGRNSALNKTMSRCIAKEIDLFDLSTLMNDSFTSKSYLKNVIRRCKNRFRKKQISKDKVGKGTVSMKWSKDQNSIQKNTI